MNYIHYTEEFKRKVETDPWRENVYKKIEDLQYASNPEALKSIDPYSKGILVLKLHGAQTSRTIIQPIKMEIEGESINVLFVRDFISKKSFDYFWGTIVHPKLSNGEWLTSYPLPEAEAEVFKREFLNSRQFLEKKSPLLPQELFDWLSGFKMSLNFDIYEREAWVNYSNDRGINGLLERHILLFRDTIKEIIQKESDRNNRAIEITVLNDLYYLYTAIYTPFNIGIIFADFPDVEGRRVIVIYDGAHLKEQSARWQGALLKAKNTIDLLKPELLNISKDAFRAYPEWIVTNSEDLWTAIQRYDGSHNLSLLPEQVAFLNRFKFPSYINGQAGSGKSTMLYYLFANVYFYKIFDEVDGEIIFLTENDHLLEHTIQSIIGLLSSNPEFNVDFSIEQRNTIRKYFCSFKNYLLGILPDDERVKLNDQHYLDFAKFKELFKSRYRTKQKHSAEEVWFVLSTYVYGYYEDKIIDTLEKYRDEENGIPSKFRIVDDENFKGIISGYLSFYNKLIESGHWDRTTLVRLIRKYYPSELPRQYTVVFCDEAQDFSRIELRLIIQSSVFTKYDLSTTDQIPVVFAGDALQTVSPTGFSDTRLHQMYFDAFKEANFKYDKNRSTYNPAFNYRSLAPIVRLANIIQQFRKDALQEEVYIKQESKRGGAGAPIPMLHTKEWLMQPQIKADYTKKFLYKSFIIPVDLNEENDFVSNEPLLNNLFADIKSSIDAKGAEYSQVVVYGFGDHFVNEFGKLDWNPEKVDFKVRFFFNKLYVAITRAQNELVIIDSSQSINSFWVPLLEIPASFSRWERYDNINEVLPISPQTGLANVLESNPDDALQNAQLDMEQGIKDGNFARLIVASNIFLMLGKVEDAHNCLAHKDMLRRNWAEAGRQFLLAQKNEDAANAFFLGKNWDELRKVSVSGNKQETRLLIAKMILGEKWDIDDLNRLSELRSNLSDILKQVEWYDELTERIISYARLENSGDAKRKLILIMGAIAVDGALELWQVIGSLYFSTKQFTDAIEAWNKSFNGFETSEYSFEYVKAHVEKAKEESSRIEELLWSGRLLSIVDTSPGELNRVRKGLVDAYCEEIVLIENSGVKQELYSNIFKSIIALGLYDKVQDLACKVEELGSLPEQAELYASLIYSCNDEGISIFLKERWVKIKMKNLASSNQNSQQAINEINSEFEKQDFPFESSNGNWSEEEIEKISDYPGLISVAPTDHVQGIVIKRFRKFHELEVNNIGQFNIVLGNNNSGKTTFLEALLFSPDPNVALRNFLYTQKQRNNNAEKEKNNNFLKNLLSANASPDDFIEISLKNGRRLWNFQMRNPTGGELVEFTKVSENDPKNFLVIKERGKHVKISEHVDVVSDSLLTPFVLKDIPFIPFGKGYSERLSAIYYEEIGQKRGLRNAFMEQMKLFVTNIADIQINPNDDTINIEEENDSGISVTHSLHDYGEGANKLFRILVQLHASKNKRLMIDEIDAGIHYSRFSEFWKIILRVANDYNVQLFATTHNEECIRYFIEALEEDLYTSYRNKSRVITLEQHLTNGTIVPLVRDFGNAEFAIINNFEVRGRKL